MHPSTCAGSRRHGGVKIGTELELTSLLADMGVLHNLSKPDMCQILNRSGLTRLNKSQLETIMEAAVLESSNSHGRSLIVTGLEIFEREKDGSLAGRTEPLFWTELPEFGHLQSYKVTDETTQSESHDQQIPIKEQLMHFCKSRDTRGMRDLVLDAFLVFLSRSMGFAVDAFDPQQALAMYAVDSLTGVDCQYWFHQGNHRISLYVLVSSLLGFVFIAYGRTEAEEQQSWALMSGW